MFVAMAVVYHGVTEILQLTVQSYSDNRLLTTDSNVAAYTVLVGFSLLAFAAVYQAVALRGPARMVLDREGIANFFEWKLLSLVALFAVAVSAAGKGFGASVEAKSEITGSPYLVGGFATQFLDISLTLGSFAILVRTKGRGLFVVLFVQCAIHTLTGQRSSVPISAGMVIYLLSLVGIRARRWESVSIVVLVVLSYLVIGGARADFGREALWYGSGVDRRLTALGAGLAHPERGISRSGIGDLGVRLDGNSFPSIILQRLEHGASPIGPVTLGDDLRIAVPRFLQPGKLNSDESSRSLKLRLCEVYGITTEFDRLPTQLGELLPVGGPVWMVFLAGVWGFLLASLERILLGCCHPAGLLGILGVAVGTLQYSGGFGFIVICVRSAIALAIVLLGWRMLRAAWKGRLRTFWKGASGVVDTSRPRRLWPAK